VLVVDDNVDGAESLRDVIGDMGHDVRVAYDGVEAIAVARAFRPEVVLCDIGLPGIDGYQVAQAFRAERELSGAHLVALTGYALPEDQRRAREAGFDVHLAKPPRPELIESLIARAPR
jgi:two-component system CheB/CheR fusion protein